MLLNLLGEVLDSIHTQNCLSAHDDVRHLRYTLDITVLSYNYLMFDIYLSAKN